MCIITCMYNKTTTTRLETVKHQREIMQQELKKTTVKTLTAEEKAHKLDQLLGEEEAVIASIEKDISGAQDKLFKRAQETKEATRSQQNMEAEIQVIDNTGNTSNTGIRVL